MYSYDLIGSNGMQTGYGYPLAHHHSTGGGLDDLKAFMEKETFGVKRKYLALGAAAIGLGYYGYTQGWFR